MAETYEKVRRERDKLRLEVQQLNAKIERLKQWQRDMIAKAADNSLAGYRELGDKLAKADNANERLRAENKRLLELIRVAACDLTTIMRMPNAEWVADAHNAAVEIIRVAALRGEEK